MGDSLPILTTIFPALFGLTFIAMSALGCRLRAANRRLVGLEMRVGALETMPMLRSVAAAPAPAPAPMVYQMPPPPPQPSAPPMMDPIPPPPVHIAVGMPTVAAVAQMQRYTGYI